MDWSKFFLSECHKNDSDESFYDNTETNAVKYYKRHKCHREWNYP